MKILIVEDSHADQEYLIKALRNNGIENEVLRAKDGQEGFEVLSEHHEEVCLILLDWQMPRVDGMAFMRGILKLPETASIPIVMVTAAESEENKNCARRVNPKLAGYIVKPYNPQKLIEVIAPYIK